MAPRFSAKTATMPQTLATSGPGIRGATRLSTNSNANSAAPSITVGTWVSPIRKPISISLRKNPRASVANPSSGSSCPAMMLSAMPFM